MRYRLFRPFQAGIVLLTTFLIALPCACTVGVQAQTLPVGETVSHYIDPAQQTALGFGDRSHYLQPWRAYEDTPPTSRLREAVGINLNVTPEQAEAVCAQLERSGFVRVRVEFGWGALSWDNPPRLGDPRAFETIVGACLRHHLRPLFLLNAHHGAPCPGHFFSVHLTAPAAKGDRVVHLDPADVAALVSGRSGFDKLTDYLADEVIFTQVAADGTATLSKPLPKDLARGSVPASTLKYLPFYPAKRADGTPSPEFAETMAGWLAYVQSIGDAAKRVFGTEGKADAGFDFEVWNELTFGSNFLSVNNYYEKPIAKGESPTAEILARTVAYVRDPAHGLPGVGIGDGFNNQWPWGAGSTAPPGLTALDKHPYASAIRFTTGSPKINAGRPLDALGKPSGKEVSGGHWVDGFTPSYVSFFPEYGLNAIQTEHWVRDLSPITTDLYGVKHGRATHPNFPDGSPAPAPEFWITEVNLDPKGADPGDLAAYTRGTNSTVVPTMTAAEADRLKAKAVLRYLVSYVNKGLTRFYFFAAHDDDPKGLGLVSPAFFAALKAGASPADLARDALASPTLRAVRRLVQAMPGSADAIHRLRPLAVVAIADRHDHRQFDGDPRTAAQVPNPHPPLRNRDCLAVFPFQADDRTHVVALYVMTRDLAHAYRIVAENADDPTRFDLPDETYRITLGGLSPSAQPPTLTLTDPLTGKTATARTVAFTHDGTLTVELPLTDSPRLLTIRAR